MYNRRHMTWLCYVGMVVIAIRYNHFAIILTRAMDSFKLTAAEAGQCGSTIFFGTIFAIPTMAVFTSHFSPKLTCLLGCAACVIGCFVEGRAQTFLMLQVGLFLQGFAGGALDLLMSPLIASMYHDDVTSEMLFLHAFYSIGSVLVTIYCTAIVSISSTSEAWRIVPWVNSVVPLLLLIGFARQTFPNIVAEDHGGDEAEETVTSLVSSPSFWLCNAMITCVGAAEYGPIMWLPTFAQDGLGFGDPVPGLLLTAFSVTMSAGRILGGHISKRGFGPLYLLLRGSLLQVVLVLFTVAVPSPYLSVLSGSLIGISVSVLWPSVLSFAASVHPSGGAKMYGSFSVFGSLGSSLIVWVVGAVKDHTGSVSSAFLTSSAGGLALVFVVSLVRVIAPRNRHPAMASESPRSIEVEHCLE